MFKWKEMVVDYGGKVKRQKNEKIESGSGFN